MMLCLTVSESDMSLVARKPVCGGLQTTKPQTSLRILYLDLLQAKFQFSSSSLCSWEGWFESRFHGNPEDRFSRDKAHIISCIKTDKPLVVYVLTLCDDIYYKVSIQITMTKP